MRALFVNKGSKETAKPRVPVSGLKNTGEQIQSLHTTGKSIEVSSQTLAINKGGAACQCSFRCGVLKRGATLAGR